MQHFHYHDEPLQRYSPLFVSVTDTEHIQGNRISMRRHLVTAGTQMILNGQRRLKCTLAAPPKLGTYMYVRTKGRFACIGATVYLDIAQARRFVLHTFIIRSAISTDADAKITLINV